MKSALKIDVDVSMNASVESLKDSSVINEISKKVIDILKEKGHKARLSAVEKASKNAVSLLLTKKNGKAPTFLSVYIPANVVESLCDTVVPTVSSDDDSSTRSVSEDDGIESDSCASQNSSSNSHDRHISFSVCNEVMKVDMTFEYLFDYFKYSLSKNNRAMNLDRILSDICAYIFLQLKCSVYIRKLKKEISLQISRIVQSARVRAAGKSVIHILRKIGNFTFFLKFINPLTEVQSIGEFIQYRNKDNSSPILLIRKTNDETDVFQFYPWLNMVEITFNDMFVKKTLSSFDVLGVLNIDELSYLISECAFISNLRLDILAVEEALKTNILFDCTSSSSSSYFSILVGKAEQIDEPRDDCDQIPTNDSPSFSEEEIDAIIGRTYTTRGVKRSYEEDPILIEPKRNKYRQNKMIKDKRDLLHLKDTYYLTDAALKAIFEYVQSKKKLVSLKEIERLRKKTNSKFPILHTKTSAYVRFEYAVRTAIFVACKYEHKLDQFDTLNIRFNMDGTLIGNKHIVAISINCIEGGSQCQAAKNLIPLGLFEVQKENTELLRQSLPSEFINDIKSVKYISIGEKNISIRIRLGGDLMNAVYVFGLAGFSSNHPCIFCTQHKDDLHVTDDTAYDKTVTEGKGKNKQTITIHVGPTSCHDLTKKARSLTEQTLCLTKNTNELGYKCEPLFGDLFDYQDYCADTLHMKLRVFDVILKDMLAYASRTGKYGGEHLAIIERKIKILNQHCERTVGKRFFFQVDTDDKNKTISSHGKLSGHLQDLFFVDSFPYDDILNGEIAKSARIVVNKFKEILVEVKHTSIRRKGVLKRLSLEFVKEFRQSGLRTTVTPYIHIIGNHLFEFDEFSNLGDYNMQGVEKNNDLLSRLYFSSTNPARNPLLTMLQKLYRMLEMNFQDEKQREAMARFACTGVYDFVEEDLSESESESQSKDNSCYLNEEDDDQSESESEENFDTLKGDISVEVDDEVDSEESLVWAPEKRFPVKPVARSQDRFKSFRRS
ncbi:unnamed protein product [Rotaria socialis]|uniref:Uncharacterized protein n=3 Tax=Rotaria TaxID=231623 RepID=A0A817S1N6_9BILA|nr:unnamed protein product [Rotaria socialis]CAF3300636.1 unnamed protein product [Rotaria socialis]